MQCVRAPPGCGEGKEQLRVKSFPQWGCRARNRELLDQVRGRVEGEAGVEVLLEQRELEVLQATQLMARPAIVMQVGQRLAAPKVEGSTSDRRCFGQLVRSSQLARSTEGRGGARSVHLAG